MPRIRVRPLCVTRKVYDCLNRFLGLEHATIRDNITFGSSAPFDEARYQSVLDACALRQDLSIFDAGDMTGVLLPFFCR